MVDSALARARAHPLARAHPPCPSHLLLAALRVRHGATPRTQTAYAARRHALLVRRATVHWRTGGTHAAWHRWAACARDRSDTAAGVAHQCQKRRCLRRLHADATAAAKIADAETATCTARRRRASALWAAHAVLVKREIALLDAAVAEWAHDAAAHALERMREARVRDRLVCMLYCRADRVRAARGVDTWRTAVERAECARALVEGAARQWRLDRLQKCTAEWRAVAASHLLLEECMRNWQDKRALRGLYAWVVRAARSGTAAQAANGPFCCARTATLLARRSPRAPLTASASLAVP